MATTALLILDGFGIGKPDPKSNAIYAQGTPNIDALKMPAVVGTLSGDDTTLVIMRDNASAERFCNEIRKMLE